MQKTQLRTGPLGRTGLEVTRVGFGAWELTSQDIAEIEAAN
jgi:aryl-alcohol dehydrogenase-like predicted oxidoreductase